MPYPSNLPSMKQPSNPSLPYSSVVSLCIWSLCLPSLCFNSVCVPAHLRSLLELWAACTSETSNPQLRSMNLPSSYSPQNLLSARLNASSGQASWELRPMNWVAPAEGPVGFIRAKSIGDLRNNHNLGLQTANGTS